MIIFVSMIVIILGSAVSYVGWRTIVFWPWAQRHPRLIVSTLAAFMASQILWPFVSRRFPDAVAQIGFLNWMVYGMLGLFGAAFFYLLAHDLLFSVIRWFWKNHEAYSPWVFYSTAVITLTSFAVGIGQALQGPQVFEVSVPIKDLSSAFHGYKIAQISDLHISRLISRKYVENVVERTNALKPDIIVLTGDFADGTVMDLRDAAMPLAKLHAPGGVYFVTGNHEYYWDTENWLKEYQRLGIQVLQNAHRVIEHESGGHEARLVLAGVNDPTGGDSDPVLAVRGAPTDALPRILLAHQSNKIAKLAAKTGYHLLLSGHTHGGQFFPWSIMVWLFQTHYKGLSYEDRMAIYTNRGTGFWGPPLRFLVSSEISLIRLNKE